MTANASISGLVEVASDCIYRTQSGITAPDNAWGGQQSRIVRFNNNVLRMSTVYHSGGNDYWRIHKSIDNGATWTVEAYAQTVDDHNLLRDKRDDSAYLVGYNSSYQLCIWSSRSNFSSPQIVPGDWQVLTSNQRHYFSASIADDGTIYLLEDDTERINPIVTYSDNASNNVMTALWYTGVESWSDNTVVKGVWQFSNNSKIIRNQIGIRYAYNYLFPKPWMSLTNDFSDKIFGCGSGNADSAPQGYSSLNQWIFIFHTFWHDSITKLNERKVIRRGLNDPGKASVSDEPFFRPEDAYIDQKGRMFVISFCLGDSSSYRANGYWLTVYDCRTYKVLADFRMSQFPSYGNLRFIEDIGQNFYILYINADASSPKLTLWKVIEEENPSLSGCPPQWTVSSASQNLSSSLGTLVPETRAIRIAQAKSGHNLTDNYFDLYLQFMENEYSGGVYPSPTYSTGGMRIFYAKINFA